MEIRICRNCHTQNKLTNWHCRECNNALATDTIVEIEQDALDPELNTSIETKAIEETATHQGVSSTHTSIPQRIRLPALPPQDKFGTLNGLISSLKAASILGVLLAIGGALGGFILFQNGDIVLGVIIGLTAFTIGVAWYFILRIIAESAAVNVVIAKNTYLTTQEVRRAVELLQQNS